MSRASLTNSRKLFNLSGWAGSENHPSEITYDLGYLLRKLPPSVKVKDDTVSVAHLEMSRNDEPTKGDWQFSYESYYYEHWNTHYLAEADTPEDAACLLAIKLFEDKVLTKEDK